VKGYLIFSGLITGITDYHQEMDPESEDNFIRARGMIVCLGWIPYNKTKSWLS